MLSISEKIETNLTTGSKFRLIWAFCIPLLLAVFLTFSQIWKPLLLANPLISSISYPSAEMQQQVQAWVLNYPDLSQAQDRHRAFRDLTKLLQQDEKITQEVEKTILLSRKSSMELIAVTVGVLSSQGTPRAQQALCNTLQAFHKNSEKVMLVLPQIMLLEKPQNFLFDELQTFIRKSRTSILRENAELTLAGLSQHAYQTNQTLAQKITSWLEIKKSTLPEDAQSLPAFLDLLGNTGNETFLVDILQATTHEDAEVRARAAYALRFFRGDRVAKALEQLTVDQNSEVKAKAAEALSYFAFIVG